MFLLSQTTIWSCIRVLKKKEQAIDIELLVVNFQEDDVLVLRNRQNGYNSYISGKQVGQG